MYLTWASHTMTMTILGFVYKGRKSVQVILEYELWKECWASSQGSLVQILAHPGVTLAKLLYLSKPQFL